MEKSMQVYLGLSLEDPSEDEDEVWVSLHTLSVDKAYNEGWYLHEGWTNMDGNTEGSQPAIRFHTYAEALDAFIQRIQLGNAPQAEVDVFFRCLPNWK